MLHVGVHLLVVVQVPPHGRGQLGVEHLGDNNREALLRIMDNVNYAETDH